MAWNVTEFEVTLWTGEPVPTHQFVARRPTTIVKYLVPRPLFLEVYARLRKPLGEPDLSLGCFWLWLNCEGMARVRVDDHYEHFARDPERSGLEGDLGGFVDEEGGICVVTASEAISAEQAESALFHWLCSGKMLSELTWS